MQLLRSEPRNSIRSYDSREILLSHATFPYSFLNHEELGSVGMFLNSIVLQTLSSLYSVND